MAAPAPTTVLRGHSGEVQALAYAGTRHLFSGDSEGVVKLWDLEDRRASVTRSLHGVQVGVLSLQHIPSGSDGFGLLVSGARDGSVHVWQLREDGAPSQSPILSWTTESYGFCKLHAQPVTQLPLSSSPEWTTGQTVSTAAAAAAASSPSPATSTTTGSCAEGGTTVAGANVRTHRRADAQGPTQPVPRGGLGAALGSQQVGLQQPQASTQEGRLQQHHSSVRGSETGFTGSSDSKQQERQQEQEQTGVHPPSATPQLHPSALAQSAGPQGCREGHPTGSAARAGPVIGAGSGERGVLVAGGGRDTGEVCIWDLRQKGARPALTLPKPDLGHWSPSAGHQASNASKASKRGTQQPSPSAAASTQQADKDDSPTSGSPLPATSGQAMAVLLLSNRLPSPSLLAGYESGSVGLWDLRSHSAPLSLIVRAHTEPVLCLAASPVAAGRKQQQGSNKDGLEGSSSIRVVSGGADASVACLKLTVGSSVLEAASSGTSAPGPGASTRSAALKLTQTLALPTPGVSDAAFRPDGRLLALGTWDGKVWLRSGHHPHKPLALLRHHTKEVTSLVWCPWHPHSSSLFDEGGYTLGSYQGSRDLMTAQQPLEEHIVQDSSQRGGQPQQAFPGHGGGDDGGDGVGEGVCSVTTGMGGLGVEDQEGGSAAVPVKYRGLLASGSRDGSIALWDVYN